MKYVKRTLLMLFELYPCLFLGSKCFPFVFCFGAVGAVFVAEVPEGTVDKLLFCVFVFKEFKVLQYVIQSHEVCLYSLLWFIQGLNII